MRPVAIALALTLLVPLAPSVVKAAPSPGALPFPEITATSKPAGNPATLIIDDVGDHRGLGKRSVDLPAEVTISILPHTPHARTLARRAKARGREVMLHLPMEPKADVDPGPGGLFLDMDEQEVREAVARALEHVPEAAGVNNHMGSLLTRHPGHMDWVMDELASRGDFYFIDSRSSARTVAEQLARENGLETAARAVFIDPQRDPEVIERQFEVFIERARVEDGMIAIAHPYPETLELLERELPRLPGRGVRLVPASKLVGRTGSSAD